jgi:hypothetical protein
VHSAALGLGLLGPSGPGLGLKHDLIGACSTEEREYERVSTPIMLQAQCWCKHCCLALVDLALAQGRSRWSLQNKQRVRAREYDASTVLPWDGCFALLVLNLSSKTEHRAKQQQRQESMSA